MMSNVAFQPELNAGRSRDAAAALDDDALPVEVVPRLRPPLSLARLVVTITLAL